MLDLIIYIDLIFDSFYFIISIILYYLDLISLKLISFFYLIFH